MTFSGLAEEYPTWSPCFSASAKNKGFFQTLTDLAELPDRKAQQGPMMNKESTRHRLKLEEQLYKRMSAAKTKFGADWQ